MPADSSEPRYSPRTFCPLCQNLIRLQDVKAMFLCPHCDAPLRVEWWRFPLVLVCAFAGSLWLCNWIGIKAYAAIAWIPIFILCSYASAIAVSGFPPKLRPAPVPEAKNVSTLHGQAARFFAVWVALTFFMLAYALAWGWFGFFAGATLKEIAEFAGMLQSLPLGLVNTAFVVTPTKDFVTVLGIVFANCFFYTAVLLALAKVVRLRLRQARMLQLGVSRIDTDDEEDEL